MEPNTSLVLARIETDRYRTLLRTNTHEIVADEPVDKGGQDAGFAPGELLAASLAACTSITLRMYADRKEMPLTEVRVQVTTQKDVENGRTLIQRDIELHGDLTDEQRQRLLQIAEKCPVHWALTHPIEISSSLV
jgi:putative redox protein